MKGFQKLQDISIALPISRSPLQEVDADLCFSTFAFHSPLLIFPLLTVTTSHKDMEESVSGCPHASQLKSRSKEKDKGEGHVSSKILCATCRGRTKCSIHAY